MSSDNENDNADSEKALLEPTWTFPDPGPGWEDPDAEVKIPAKRRKYAENAELAEHYTPLYRLAVQVSEQKAALVRAVRTFREELSNVPRDVDDTLLLGSPPPARGGKTGSDVLRELYAAVNQFEATLREELALTSVRDPAPIPDHVGSPDENSAARIRIRGKACSVDEFSLAQDAWTGTWDEANYAARLEARTATAVWINRPSDAVIGAVRNVEPKAVSAARRRRQITSGEE